SGVVAYGRVGVSVALSRARAILTDRAATNVLVAACDSLLVGSTVKSLDREGRLLTTRNSNGFVPGEAAGAIMLTEESGRSLSCVGLGFGEERVTVSSEEPLRADGLTEAIRKALQDAGCQMHELDFRVTDISGEHYYFKEAALALTRTMHQRKPEFNIWHPADCTGETGAAAGIVALTVALTACRKGYA